MEVYAPNGTLIRTSSYPDGFIAQGSGGVEGLETTIKDSTLQSVTANVTFRDLDKTEVLSNDLKVNLNLAENGTTSATAGKNAVTETVPLAEEYEQDKIQVLFSNPMGKKKEVETATRMKVKENNQHFLCHCLESNRT